MIYKNIHEIPCYNYFMFLKTKDAGYFYRKYNPEPDVEAVINAANAIAEQFPSVDITTYLLYFRLVEADIKIIANYIKSMRISNATGADALFDMFFDRFDKFAVDAYFLDDAVFYNLQHYIYYFGETTIDMQFLKPKKIDILDYRQVRSKMDRHLWFMQRSIIFSPKSGIIRDNVDYFQDFYKVKLALDARITPVNTSVAEYLTYLNLLKNEKSFSGYKSKI